MLLQVTTGNEAFRAGSCKYHAFIVKTQRHPMPPPHSEVHINIATTKGLFGTRRVSGTRIPSASGMVDMGAWVQGVYDLPDGMVIKLWGHRSLSGRAVGASQQSNAIGALLLRIRSGAALRRVTCNTVPDSLSNNVPVRLEGRFDFVSLAEAGRLGVPLTVDLTKQLASPMTRNLFQMEVLDAETETAAVQTTQVVQTDGERVVVPVAKRPRAINLDD